MACLLFIISLCLYTSVVSKGCVSVDCLNLVVQSHLTLTTHHLQYLYGSGYPLMVLLGVLFTVIGKCLGCPDPVLAVNFIGVIFGSMAVAALYKLMRRMTDTPTALIASLLLLFDPIFLDISTYGINHAPALCFFLLGLLSLLDFQGSKKISALLLSALYFGCMGAVRLQDLAFTFPAVVALFFSGKDDQNQLQKFIVFINTMLVIIVLFHLPYLLADQNHYHLQFKNYWKTGSSGNHPSISWMHLTMIFAYLMRSFTGIGLLGCCAGLAYAWGANRRLWALSIVWWAGPLVFYANLFPIAPHFLIGMAPRFLTIMLPAFIIPISIFLAYFLKHEKKVFRVAAFICCLMIIFLPLKNTAETFVRRHHVDLIADFYRWVGRTTEADAVIISSDDRSFIDYYSKRMALLNPQGIDLSAKQLADFKEQLDQNLGQHHPVYITQMGLSAYDHDSKFQDFMVKNYRLKWIGKRPLELWYQSPFLPQLHRFSLIKIEKM